MVLCVAGGVEHKDIFDMANDKFGNLEILMSKGHKKLGLLEVNMERKRIWNRLIYLAFEAPKSQIQIYSARVFTAIPVEECLQGFFKR